MEPAELAEKLNMEYTGKKIVGDLEFAKFKKTSSEFLYFLLHSETQVGADALVDVYLDGEQVMGVLNRGEIEVEITENGPNLEHLQLSGSGYWNRPLS